MYPNFIIIGPPKCASTSLNFYLGQHPEIFVAKIKETRFFSLHYDKGMDFYTPHFKDAGKAKAIGEATPSYSFLPFVADRIKQHLPNAKLILCFRNPLDRAFSSWLMQKGIGKELLPFREAIDINKKQMGYITLEGAEGAKTWTQNIGNYSADDTRLRTYLQAGMFAEILKIWYKRFNPGQVKVVFLHDLKNDFDGTLKSIFNFLGVDDSLIIPYKENVILPFHR